MVAYVTPFVDRAKEFLKSEELEDLYHAALELRFAIEEIAYEKLKLRDKNLAPDEIDKWQPGRVIQQLQDLVDPTIGSDAQLFIKPEQGPGSEEEPKFVGASKGINFKEVSRHWQKLGSYLHRQKPVKGEKVGPTGSDPKAVKAYLEEVKAYVEELTSTSFDGFFSQNVTFKCFYCGTPILRTESSLEDKQIIRCYSQECSKELLILQEGKGWSITPNNINFPCKKCEAPLELNTADLQRVPKEFPVSVAAIVACDKCETEHQVSWSLRYGLRHGNASEGSNEEPNKP